jgi:hypothetical protein
MKYFLVLLALFHFEISSVKSQNISIQPEFGKFSKEETELKKCDFEPDAEAVVLLDKAWTFNWGYFDYTIQRIRIKILNEKGINQGNILIPINSFNLFTSMEYIDSVRALTFNKEGDSTKITYLDKSSVFLEEGPSNSYIKFAMPEVRVGSIIEYEYIKTMKSIRSLGAFTFQHEIPTLKACYILSPPPGIQLSYGIHTNPEYPIINKFIPDTGTYFEMNNIPSLKLEPFMDAPKDYFQEVIFQVSRDGNRQINDTWEDVANSFLKGLGLKKQMDKNLHKRRELKDSLKGIDNPIDKIRIIYNYVKRRLKWNGRNAIKPIYDLDEAWDMKKGNAAEINFILINLLKEYDIEAYPLLVAEREYGKVDVSYPFLDQFNKVVAFAISGDKQFVLDATEENGYIDLIPHHFLNTNAFLLDLKNYSPVTINSNGKSYKSQIKIYGSMDPDGNFKGDVHINSYEYAKQYRTSRIKNDLAKYKKGFFNSDNYSFELDSFSTGNIDSDTLPLKMYAKIRNKYEKTGGYYVFNYNLFTNLESNPFPKAKRVSNVNFGYPDHFVLEASLTLPPNASIENALENKSISNESQTMHCSRIYSLKDQVVYIRIEFLRSVSLVSAEDYNDLREFYKEVTNMLNEPLLIKVPVK